MNSETVSSHSHTHTQKHNKETKTITPHQIYPLSLHWILTKSASSTGTKAAMVSPGCKPRSKNPAANPSAAICKVKL